MPTPNPQVVAVTSNNVSSTPMHVASEDTAPAPAPSNILRRAKANIQRVNKFFVNTVNTLTPTRVPSIDPVTSTSTLMPVAKNDTSPTAQANLVGDIPALGQASSCMVPHT
jgi:hypothetical protein